jgi:hypothetical protein
MQGFEIQTLHNNVTRDVEVVKQTKNRSLNIIKKQETIKTYKKRSLST